LTRSLSTSSCQQQMATTEALSQRGVMTAVQEEVEDPRYGAMPAAHPVPNVSIDLYGTVSVSETGTTGVQDTGVYRNVDGQRFDDGRYAAFRKEIGAIVPEKRIFTDAVRMFAYGTDASFYRLNPKMVVKVHSEEEVAKILPIAKRLGVPVTFRAAGTSLSGQAVTDSVLLKLSHTGRNFRSFTVHEDGSKITVEPGLIGGEVNRILAAHKNRHNMPIQYKIGPDPSSIDSCMIGGIVSNNSSGMCCGVAQNSYHTVADMRITFVDGTTLDTADPESRKAFLESHKDLVAGIIHLAQQTQGDRELASLIRRKFAIKCTTGYSLNALVDFPVSDPIEIIKRLMIGSEGTFGFISRVTYNTVPDWPNKASAFIVFPHVRDACRAAAVLRDNTTVDAVEMFDRACLRECENHDKMPELVPCVKGSDPMAAALLVECRGQTTEALEQRIKEVTSALEKSNIPFGSQASHLKPLSEFPFSHDPEVYNVFWDVRKGLIPMVGGSRETGTSMLIEDVACPIGNLADMTIDLGKMFEKYGYTDASCFGHALEGNLHLVFSQGFRNREEVERFSELMSEMSYIVATKHGGSLKGEHGTGRNMAPFVELEWGSKAYQIMWELKKLFDPDFVLNPSVLLNDDTAAHIKFLKPSPPASPIVDRCIECGFCESNCPSRDLTLTPRQRITVYREMSRLRALPNRSQQEDQRLKEFEELFEYLGEQTCAADGMCQEKCPVKINTGELIKSLRAEDLKNARATNSVSMMLANNFGMFQTAVPYLLDTVNLAHRVVGPSPLSGISSWLNRVTDHFIPAWNPYMPRGAARLQDPPKTPATSKPQRGIPRRVVYLPSCVTRMMGPSLSDYEVQSVHQKLMSLFEKAGYEVIYPKGIANTCCGSMFNSRGLKAAAKTKVAELEEALFEASEGGMIPIVSDTSPCLAELKGSMTNKLLTSALYEPVEFISRFLSDKLEFSKVRDTIAIHVPCSSKKMGIERSFAELAGKCAHEVVHSGIPCCGMAGDKGMRFPELTGSSLQHLNLPANCTDGYSTSRTCEITLSDNSGINFRGLVYLVDEATSPKRESRAAA